MSDEVYPNVKKARESRIAAAEAQGWSGPWRFGNEHLHGTPPCGVRTCNDGDHVPSEIDKLIVKLHQKIDSAEAGLEAVASLINESHGVLGLHLNGDLAPWSELRTGGEFEEWLIAFDDALNAARSSNPTLHPPGCSAAEPR